MREFSIGPLVGWVETPEADPKCRVLLVHGMSEHSGRYSFLVESFLKHGIEVVRFDLRGCGKSGGIRQWVEKFEDYTHDITEVFSWVQGHLSPLTTFLYAHSLGSSASIPFLVKYQKLLKGAVLSAPAYKVGQAFSPWTILIGKLIEKIYPTFVMKSHKDYGAVSRDEQVVQAFKNDPLCTHFATVHFGLEILNYLPSMVERVSEVELPVLMVHGTADRIMRLEGSYELLKALGSKDKELFVIPGGFHEPHNDIGREDYFQKVLSWFQERLA